MFWLVYGPQDGERRLQQRLAGPAIERKGYGGVGKRRGRRCHLFLGLFGIAHYRCVLRQAFKQTVEMECPESQAMIRIDLGLAQCFRDGCA